MNLRGRRIALLLGLAAAACGGADAHVDAGDPEADASRGDASHRFDGAASDVSDASQVDAGPVDPGWVAPTDLVGVCSYEIATHPEMITQAGIIPIPWIACGAGCRRTATGGFPVLDAFRVAGHELVVLSDSHEIAPHWLQVERHVVDVDSTTVAATRFELNGTDHLQPECDTEHFGANGTDIGFEVNYSRYDATGSHVLQAWIRTYRGTYDDLASTAHRTSLWTFPTGRGGNVVTAVDLTPNLVTFGYVSSDFVSQPDGSAMPVSAALHLSAAVPFHVGDDVLFAGSTLDGPSILARSIGGADAELLREVTGGDVVVFYSDGATLAWLEGTGFDTTTSTWASMSLWSGSYDTTTHALTGTRLRDMSAVSLTAIGVGGGYYAQSEPGAIPGNNVYGVYRLADGLRATFDPLAAGGAFPADNVRLVTADEILFDTNGVLFRVDPRTLTFS